MTEAGGGRYFGYVFRGGEGNPVVADFMPIFWSYGADLFNEDRSAVTIDTPEAAKAMETFMALKETAPQGVESYSADEVGRALAAGTAASSINWPNWVATFEDPSQSQVVGKISYSPIPAGTNPGSSEIGHWTMGIMKASENKQEAFDFMIWATSPEQIKISATRGNPPVRRSVFTDPELTAQDQFRHYPILMEAIEASTPRPRHPEMAGNRERARQGAFGSGGGHDHAGRGADQRAGGGGSNRRALNRKPHGKSAAGTSPPLAIGGRFGR